MNYLRLVSRILFNYFLLHGGELCIYTGFFHSIVSLFFRISGMQLKSLVLTVSHSTCVEVVESFCSVDSFSQPCGFPRSNSCHQVCWQGPLPTEPFNKSFQLTQNIHNIFISSFLPAQFWLTLTPMNCSHPWLQLFTCRIFTTFVLPSISHKACFFFLPL